MELIEHAQTVLTVSVLKKLKEITGTESTQKALQISVEHTIKTYIKPKEAQV